MDEPRGYGRGNAGDAQRMKPFPIQSSAGYGSAENPIRMPMEQYQRLRDEVFRRERILDALPPDKHDAYIKQARREINLEWPRIYPHCHVRVE